MKWSDIQPAGDQPTAKLKWSDIGKVAPEIEAAAPPDRAVEDRAAPPQSLDHRMGTDARGFLDRMWKGFVGGDVSRAGRFGMGLADPVYGGAQIGSMMGPEIGGAAFETPQQNVDRMEAVHTAIDQRETGYQQREKAAGLSGGIASEWARILGQGVSTAPLAAVPAVGATIPARLGLAAAAGAGGGATMPVTGPNQGQQRGINALLGGVGGAAGQGLGEGIGAGVGAVGRQMRPANAPIRPPGPMTPATQQAVQQRFQQAAPMSPAGVRGAPDIATQQANRVSGVQSIVAEKPNLVFETPKGLVNGRLPENRQELAEAVEQTKNSLFQKWDKMTSDTGQAVVNPAVTTVNKFRQAYRDATQKIEVGRRDLERAQFKLAAELTSQENVGGNAGAVRTAARGVKSAENALEAAQNEQKVAVSDMHKPWVDLKPAASELTRFAEDPALRITPGSGAATTGKADTGVVKYARDEAAKYLEEEAASPRVVQQAITKANASLKSFYKNPNYESAARAGVDALVANKLRSGLDDIISKVTGPGYQQLKLQYGALSAIEKDTTRAAIRMMGDSPDARFIDGLTNITSAEQLLEGLATLRFDPAMRGLLLRAGRMLERHMNSPDRAVKLMFQQAERNQRIGQAGFVAPALSRALSLEAPDYFREKPEIGDRGPYGGKINAINTIRRDAPTP